MIWKPEYAQRLLVTGDRMWENPFLVGAVLWELKPKLIIEGEAEGVDTWARLWAEHHDVPFLPFPADWNRYGRAAGPMRNRKMVREGFPTGAVWFHENLRFSKGTKDMVEHLTEKNIPTIGWREVMEW